MAMTNYERQKRWRGKHPGLAKLRRKQYEKKSQLVEQVEPLVEVSTEIRAETPSAKKTLESLRALMAAESAKPAPVAESVVAPRVYRDDYGRVITEAQWNELQKRKFKAASGGYVIDEFSQ